MPKMKSEKGEKTSHQIKCPMTLVTKIILRCKFIEDDSHLEMKKYLKFKYTFLAPLHFLGWIV